MAKDKSATKKLLKITGILVLLLVIGGVAANMMGWMDSGDAETTVETANAELRTITQIVSASGRIQPETEVIIRPDVSGEIIELNVQEGDFIREGDLLLRIKPDIYQARIDELSASLLSQQSRMEEARSNMLQAQSEFRKSEQLYEQNLISETEFNQSKTTYEARQANLRAAEYQIQSAQAQLRRAEEELQQTVIRAPRDGTISRLSVEEGERVLGNAQTAGTEMMRIARMEQMEVEVDVNENDIVNVSPNDTTLIEVDAYPNRIFEGLVTEIANSADVSGGGSADQVTNYKVKIRIVTPHNLDQAADRLLTQTETISEVPESVPSFKPGMSGTVDIKTNTVYNVVSVPIQAVTVRDFAEDDSNSDDEESEEAEENETSEQEVRNQDEDFRRVVFLNDNGKAKRVEVETGISDNTHIQIMSGVAAGDEVITGSYRVLSRELEDGDPIVVQNRNEIVASGGN